MYDWLLVGGGLHGCHIALRLFAACPEAQIAVLDAQPTALTAWQRRADACSMHILRSPQSHHLGLRSDALRVYARRHGYYGQHAMGRYRRPSRPLFEAHARAITQAVPRLSAHVAAIERAGAHWRVYTVQGACYTARNVVLAPGPTVPRRPAWGHGLPHVFAPGFAATTADWSPAHTSR